MDFKEILDAWGKKRASSAGQQDMEELLSRYPPKGPKEADLPPGEDSGADPRRRNHGQANQGQSSTGRANHGQSNHRAQEPQASLDLHGMNSLEAEQALENFILECRRRGLRKVLIVHGKGHHSQGEPVLQGVVRRYLEKSPYTGAFGPGDRRHGGRGATWVVVRKADRNLL
jgi:DNA-nicking Smr family endonuclease